MSATWEERSQGVLDEEQVAELRQIPGEGSDDLFTDVARLFLRTCPELLGKMEEALAAGDAPSLARLAHTLKGSSSNLGALKLAAKSHQMEQLAIDGRADLGAEFEELSGNYAELEGLLKEITG